VAIAVAFAGAACFAGTAQAQTAAPKKQTPAAAPAQDAKAFAKLQAKAHRIMAKIVEAESADKPDQAKIDKLYANLEAVRTEMRSYGVGAGLGRGGPGWRRGGGAGFGRGGGPGWQAGGAAGSGRARGVGARGRGPGWRGAGAARGAGANAGNCQPGQCQGPNWSDRDGNGVCDYYEGKSAGTPPASSKKGK